MIDRRAFLVSGGAGAGALVLLAAGASAAGPDVAPLSRAEVEATLARMRPPKRARPVIAIVADNRGAETADLMIPYAVLQRSGVADVSVVAPDAGPIQLMPALKIRPQATLAAFDRLHPDGADYVITPYLHHEDCAPVIDWLRAQSRRGATLVGVCAGVKTLGLAGLLDHHRATSHWSEVAGLRRRYPTMTWVPDRRYVADPGLITTTGVTASLPMSLALVNAIAGEAPALALAASLGVSHYDARHRSADFALNANGIAQAVGNGVRLWDHETLGLSIAEGVDDIALAFTADAWSRTYRSRVVTLGDQPVVRTVSGLEVIADQAAASGFSGVRLPPLPHETPARSLDTALAAISARYGPGTAGFVALQNEYPWKAT